MPPSSGAIRAGRAFVELFADDSKLVRGLKSAQKKLEGYGKGVRSSGLKMMALGGAIVGGRKGGSRKGNRLLFLGVLSSGCFFSRSAAGAEGGFQVLSHRHAPARQTD